MWSRTLIDWGRERERFITAAVQWLWIVVVVAFCAIMAQYNWDRLDFSRVQASPSAIALSFTLVAFGKVLAGLSSGRVYRLTVGEDWKFAFLAYHLSQPGKYIPGSVWQHISRAYLYRSRGVRAGAIAGALTTEAVWVLVTAMALGMTLLLFTRPGVVWGGIGLVAVKVGLFTAMLVVIVIAIAAACIYVAFKRYGFFSLFVRCTRSIDGTLIVLLIGMWVIFGLSLSALLPTFNHQGGFVLYTIGLFAIAYALGFVVIFAPAGLGVREAVLGAGLGYFVDITTVIVVIAVHRILYLANDAAFFFAAFLWRALIAAESDAGN
jgi:hypothetical protein